jgi:hypothetical protein
MFLVLFLLLNVLLFLLLLLHAKVSHNTLMWLTTVKATDTPK